MVVHTFDFTTSYLLFLALSLYLRACVYLLMQQSVVKKQVPLT